MKNTQSQITNIEEKGSILKYFVVAVVAIVVIAVAILAFNRNKELKHQKDTEGKWYQGESIIAHAMGGIDDKEYTNSKEAFIHNYEIGTRIFEVDFTITADNQIACTHGWGGERQEGIDNDHIPDLETFLNTPIYQKYTPMSIDMFLDLLEEYPDAYVVTDLKHTTIESVVANLEQIVQKVKDAGKEELLDRFIIQFYEEDQIARIREIYPFQNTIFTLYKRGFDETEKEFKQIASFCQKNQVDSIVMWDYWWHPEFKKIKDKYDVKVYVHTVNDIEEAVNLMQSGVDGIYTDFIGEQALIDALEQNTK